MIYAGNKDDMFSKIGHQTTQKFYLLQHKDLILNPKKRLYYAKIYTVPNKVKEIVNEVNNKEEENEDELFLAITQANNIKQNKIIVKDNIKKNKLNKRKLNKNNITQPFYKIISRETNSYNNNKNNYVPPVGIYNPKIVQKNDKILRNYNFERKIKKNKKSKVLTHISDLNPDKLKAKIKGSIELSKMSTRIASAVIKNININLDYDNNKKYKIKTFEFNKIQSRNNYNIQNNINLSYNPNYEFGKKRIGSAVPYFDSYIERNNIIKKNYINETIFEYEKAIENKNNNIYKNIAYPIFNKYLNRDRPLTCKK